MMTGKAYPWSPSILLSAAPSVPRSVEETETETVLARRAPGREAEVVWQLVTVE